jgi:hypothetical protein
MKIEAFAGIEDAVRNVGVPRDFTVESRRSTTPGQKNLVGESKLWYHIVRLPIVGRVKLKENNREIGRIEGKSI